MATGFALLEDCLYLLKREWAGAVRLLALTRDDHLRGDGAACGSIGKLLLDEGPIETCIPIVCYIYPSLDWTMTPFRLQVDAAVERWLAHIEEWFGRPAAQARVVARTALFKEELIAAAWAPIRVQRWLEAGLEVEDL